MNALLLQDERCEWRGAVAIVGPSPYTLSPMSDPVLIIQAVVQRAPRWLRHDLSSHDAAVRTRAEETIAAMIADALAKAGTTEHPGPEPLG